MNGKGCYNTFNILFVYNPIILPFQPSLVHNLVLTVKKNAVNFIYTLTSRPLYILFHIAASQKNYFKVLNTYIETSKN